MRICKKCGIKKRLKEYFYVVNRTKANTHYRERQCKHAD